MACNKNHALTLVRRAERIVVRAKLTTSRYWQVEVTREAAITAIEQQYSTARLCVYNDRWVEGLVVLGARV